MRLIDLRQLTGPNVFTSSPVTVARFELDDLTSKETTDFGGFAERLAALLPGLASHHCAAGRPGGFLDAMARGTYFGHVTEHVALELSGLAGREVHLGRTMWAGADGRYDVMTECPADEPRDSQVPGALLDLALQLVHDVLGGRTPEFAARVDGIAAQAERERLGIDDWPRSTVASPRPSGDSGAPGRQRQPAPARPRGESALRVRGAHEPDLRRRRRHRRGQEPVQAAARRSRDSGARRRRRMGCRGLGRGCDQLGGQVVIKPLGGSHGANLTIGVRTSSSSRLMPPTRRPRRRVTPSWSRLSCRERTIASWSSTAGSRPPRNCGPRP